MKITTSIPDHVMMKMNTLMNNRVAIFSDLHMGVHCNSPTWHNTSKQWAKWFANELKSHNITDVIFCGDFFHDRDFVSVDTMQAACDVLQELTEFNLHMFPGNHDCFYKQHAGINSLSILQGWKNITIYHKPQSITTSGGYKFMMCPWGTTLEDIEQCDAVFGHFEIQTFKMNTFKLCDHGLTIRKLLEKSSLVFSGHFHFREERLFEIGKIIYVGNPFQMDMNDSGNSKGYYIFDASSKSIDFYENKISPLLFKYKLSQIKNNAAGEEELSNITNNIIQFVIDEQLPEQELEELKAKIKLCKPLEIEFIDDISVSIGNQKTAMSSDGVDIEQALIEFIDLMEYTNKHELQEYALNIFRKYK
jgi:DNA repair exonuclease SbcCD nuclease subunit